MEINHNIVVIKKEKKGDEGSKHFNLDYTAATEILKHGFGTKKKFVLRSKVGKETDVGNTNCTYIPEFL